MEKMFLAIYSAPALQAMVGLGATDEPARKKPGRDQEHVALIPRRAEVAPQGSGEGARQRRPRSRVSRRIREHTAMPNRSA